MSDDGVVDLTISSTRICDMTISLEGFESVRVRVGRQTIPKEVVLRRIGSEGILVEPGTINVRLLNIPKAARKAFGQGEAAAGRGHWAEAEGCFREAVRLHPGYAVAWDELGLSLEAQGKRQDAAAAFERAVREDSTFARPLVHLAGLEILAHDWEKAARLTDRAIALNPANFPRAWFYDATVSVSRGNLERAESSARRVLETDSTVAFPRAEFILGMALAARGDSRGATEHLQKYLQMEPWSELAAKARQQLATVESRSHQ